jgi:choline kinase
MIAVILSAGYGTRIPEITSDLPKSLIVIGDKTILERQIEILSKNLIEKIYVVIGYKAELIREKTKEFKNLHLIENKEFATTDNIFSLHLTKKFISGKEFLLINGDVVFDEEIIKILIEKKGLNIAPVDSKYYDLEELKVKEDNGLITEILPKKTPKEHSDGSSIGIFKFSSEGSSALFFEINKIINEGIKDKWFEFALNNILKNIQMYKIDIKGLKWIEIDTYNDYKKSIELFGE